MKLAFFILALAALAHAVPENMIYQIAGQEEVVVYFVDSTEQFCGYEVVGCADLNSRNVYVVPGWGNMDYLVGHEVAHVALKQSGHPESFYAKVAELNRYYGGN